MCEAYSIVVPCYDEESTVLSTLQELELLRPAPAEIIVVDDGSSDGTLALLQSAASSKLKVLEHRRNRGYGASLKSGIAAVDTDLIVITDADGTYPNDRIPDLVKRACDGVDMVVGARTGDDVQYSLLRRIPKFFMRRYCSFVARTSIPDMNSGLRVFRKSAALRYVRLLPDGFSFTTTITLAMITDGRDVEFTPINYRDRPGGKSKIRPLHDTLNFTQLIVRTATYFAPLRVFLPVSFGLFVAFGASLAYDIWARNLTDKTVLLVLFALNTGMFGLLADMINKRS